MGRVTVRYRRGGTCYAHAMHMTECTDVPTPLQAEGDMPLHVASRRGDPDAVQALVDSKADLEALDEVAMWAMQCGAASEKGAMALGKGCTSECSVVCSMAVVVVVVVVIQLIPGQQSM